MPKKPTALSLFAASRISDASSLAETNSNVRNIFTVEYADLSKRKNKYSLRFNSTFLFVVLDFTVFR